MASTKVVLPTSEAEAEVAIATGSWVLNFCAEWCEPCVHMNAVFGELAEEHTAKGLRFMQARQYFPRACCLLPSSLPHVTRHRTAA